LNNRRHPTAIHTVLADIGIKTGGEEISPPASPVRFLPNLLIVVRKFPVTYSDYFKAARSLSLSVLI